MPALCRFGKEVHYIRDSKIERTLLLVDDHALVRQGLAALLAKSGKFRIAGEAQNGREAIELAEKLKPDMIIMDVFMPDLNGLEATRRIKAQNPQIRILALTLQKDMALLKKLMDAGASGYILKENAPQELLEAVDMILSGKTYISKSFSEDAVELFSVKKLRKKESSELLTPREREIVQLIAEGKASKEIAAHLNISVKTVETHRMHIMEKLDIHNVAELVRYAIRAGIV